VPGVGDDHADAIVAQRDHVRPYRTRRLVRVGGSDRGQGDPAAPGQREPAVRARRWHVAHHTPPEPAAYPEVARREDPIHSKEPIAVGNGRVGGAIRPTGAMPANPYSPVCGSAAGITAKWIVAYGEAARAIVSIIDME
jgi:hypothetical protein